MIESKLVMKITLFKTRKEPKSEEFKREALIKQGREQFKKLVEKGIGVPVVLL